MQSHLARCSQARVVPGRSTSVVLAGRGTKERRLPRKTTRCNVAGSVSHTELGTASWPQFVESFSGEWEGVTASFHPGTGAPIPLPERYVPEAFREWGLEVCDWQSTCSSRADPSCTPSAGSPSPVTLVCRRMMPTVGCEADAIAFTEETMQHQQHAGGLIAYSADGSYIAGPSSLSPSSTTSQPPLIVEMGLVLTYDDPQGRTSGGDRRPVRVRVQHHLEHDKDAGRWNLSKVDLHHERWDSPYRGLMELCGCGGGMPTFAQGETITEGQLPPAQQHQNQGRDTIMVVTRLPLGIWTRAYLGAAQVTLEAGGLMRQPGQLKPSTEPTDVTLATCTYTGDELVQCALDRHAYAQ